MKKLLSIVLSLCMLIGITSGINFHVYAGTYGEYEYNIINSTTAEITNYIGQSREITIPSYINGYKIVSIGDYAFDNDLITKVTIPDTVKRLGVYSFASDSLKEVNIKSGLEKMDRGVFYYCESLTKINLPNTLKEIGEAAFCGCSSLLELSIPNSVSFIDSGAFQGSGLKKVELPSSIESISSGLYRGCKNLVNIIIPDNISRIEDNAFYECYNIKTLSIGKNLKSIGDYVFCDSEITDVFYGGSLSDWNNVYIGEGNENLSTARIHNGTTKDDYYLVNSTPANCKNQGENIYLCPHGYMRSELINKTNHQYKVKKATLKKDGAVRCEICGDIKSVIAKPKTIKLSKNSYTYNGKSKKATVTVTDSNGRAIASNNYTVSYASGLKNIGKYAVKITFKGNYSGSKTLYFTINPKNTSITSLTAGSKKFTVKLKKYTTQTTGYEVQYATNSSFKSAKTVSMKNTTTSKTVSKLAGKKKYYVRVRTYKTVDGKKYYSCWSKAKIVTTKK